ncbi:MAG: ECF transporter S component [Sporolactobacillus sp.]
MVQMTQHRKTYRLVLLSILTTVIILQTFIPMLGNIPLTPIFSLTLIHITVIITALVLGPWEGALIGTVWGVGSCLRAYIAPTSPIEQMVFTNPLIAVLPRLLVGLTAGYSYRALRKIKRFDFSLLTIASVIGALTNTVLVLGLIFFIYRAPYAHSLHVSYSHLLPALAAIIVTNGIPEAIAAGFVAPIVSKALRRVVPHD